MAPRDCSKWNFCINRKYGEAFEEKLLLEKFFYRTDTRENMRILKKGGGPSEGEQVKKLAPRVIFFKIPSGLRINRKIDFYILSERMQ